jgi:hypothetical protein
MHEAVLVFQLGAGLSFRSQVGTLLRFLRRCLIYPI